MSTKIYNGLRLIDSGADLFTVIPQVAKVIRKELGKAAQALVGEELARAADDKKLREETKPTDNLWFEVEERWRKRQAAWGPHHRLNDPLRFSIVFGRSDQGNILVNWYGEHQGYEKALKKTGLFEDYGYWNNTDEPEDMTYEEWQARGKEWDSLMDKDGTFGSLPLWELGSSSDPWRHMFLGKITQEDLNIYRTQEQRLSDALASSILEELMSNGKREDLMAHYGKAKRIVRKFLTTDAGKALPFPELLPTDFMVKVGDLPPLYSVTPELVQEMIAGGE